VLLTPRKKPWISVGGHWNRPVGVFVGVLVDGTTVFVGVLVGEGVRVGDGVLVGVFVGVAVLVGVFVGVLGSVSLITICGSPLIATTAVPF
jgi:hypothetical protein